MKNLSIAFCLLALCKGLTADLFPRPVPLSFSSCKEQPGLINIDFKDIDQKGKFSWNGNITLPMTVDPSMEFTWELRWWKNNAWEANPHVIKGKVCFYMEKFGGKLWQDMSKKSKPPMGNCPIKANTYVFDNLINDYSGMKIPGMHKGKWQGKIQFGKEKSICAILEVEMV